MAVTKADIAAELARRQAGGGQPQHQPQQQPQQAQPQQSMMDRGMQAAGDILPYAAGAMGGAAGVGAMPFGGPAMPYVGAGLGYAAGKGLVRGVQQMRGKEPPNTSLMQGMGQASQDVAGGMALEMAPLAAAKALKGGVKAVGGAAKSVLPGLLKVTANVPQEATKYALEHPGEVLKMAAPEATQRITQGVGMARETFGRYIADQKMAAQKKFGQLSTEIGAGIRGLSKGVEKWGDEAEEQLVGLRTKEGVITPMEEKVKNVLGRGPKATVIGPEKLMKDFAQMPAQIKNMDPMQAFNHLMDYDSHFERAIASSKDEMTSVVLNNYRQQLRQAVDQLPIDAKTKAEEIGYRKGLQMMKGLDKKFNTPGRTASIQDVTKAVDFLEKNAHRLDPKEAYKTGLSTRMAIDRGLPKELTNSDHAFVAAQREKLQGVLERIPGMDHLRSADAAYHAAADADRMLSDAFESPTKTRNLLEKVFSGEDPQSPELMQKLLALEKRSGQPVLQKLQQLWEERKVVENAKFPFENEFSDPGATEKFLHGLFVNGGKSGGPEAAEARYKLEQVKKILGTQAVDDMFKAFAADAFHNNPGRAYALTRIAGAAGGVAATALSGAGYISPFVTGGALALGTLGSPAIMKKAIGAGAKAGAGITKVGNFMGVPGRAMQALTATGILKQKRKEE